MARPVVAAVSLGGTITMTSARADGLAARPALNAGQLFSLVPVLSEIADAHAVTLKTLPGASLTFHDVLNALSWARSEVKRGAVGALIIQGTDTIEETAYLLDVYWDQQAPLVVTGAMRPSQAPGADGPANLVASVRVAIAAQSRGRGVLVVMNDEIHAAGRVRKMRASALNAFVSPSFGALGYVEEGRPVYGGPASDRRVLSLPQPFVVPRVALLETFLDDDGAMLEVIAADQFQGIVLAGFGVGHVSAAIVGKVERAARALPVVLASRTGAGSTHQNSYGFTGSESDLCSRGVIAAGWLDARKARVLLTCLLAAGADRTAIADEFGCRRRSLGAEIPGRTLLSNGD